MKLLTKLVPKYNLNISTIIFAKNYKNKSRNIKQQAIAVSSIQEKVWSMMKYFTCVVW